MSIAGGVGMMSLVKWWSGDEYCRWCGNDVIG